MAQSTNWVPPTDASVSSEGWTPPSDAVVKKKEESVAIPTGAVSPSGSVPTQPTSGSKPSQGKGFEGMPGGYVWAGGAATPAPTPVPAPKKKKEIYQEDSDNVLMNAIKRGLNQADLAAQMTATGGDPTMKMNEEIARIQKENRQLKSSEAYQKFNNATTTSEAWAALTESPSSFATIVAELTLESLTAQAKHGLIRAGAGAATGAAVGSVIPGAGTAAGAGAGIITGLGLASLNLEYSGKMLEVFEEMGFDTTNPFELEKAFSDEKKVDEARSTALKKSIPVFVFDAISGGIAGRIATKPAKSILGKAATEAIELGTQAGLGMAGEATGQIVAGEKINPVSILAEGIGELGPGTAEIIGGRVYRKIAQPKNPKEAVSTIVAAASPNADKAALVKDQIDLSLMSGEIDNAQADEYANEAIKALDADKTVPVQVEGIKRVDVLPIIIDKSEVQNEILQLEKQKETTDAAFHPMIDTEINTRITRIDELTKQIQSILTAPAEVAPTTVPAAPAAETDRVRTQILDDIFKDSTAQNKADALEQRMNNAEEISMTEINDVLDGLYKQVETVMDNYFDNEAGKQYAQALLDKIDKIKSYEFATDKEVAFVTERKAVQTARNTVQEAASVINLARAPRRTATITSEDGTTGTYSIEVGPDGAVTFEQQGAEPIQVGNVNDVNKTARIVETVLNEKGLPQSVSFSVTDQNGKLHTITVEAKANLKPQQLLDLAINIRANELGTVDPTDFDTAYEEVTRTITKPTTDAVQVKTAGQVPVQPEAIRGETDQKGKPQAEPQEVAKEGQVQEQVTTNKKNALEDLRNAVAEMKRLGISEAVQNITKLFAGSGLRVKVILDSAEYDAVTGAAGSQGIFKSKEGVIYLNPSLMEEGFGRTIVYHEGTHPIINIIRNTDRKTYDALVAGLKELRKTNKGVDQAFAWAEKTYEGYPDQTIEDESIVETLARIADGQISLDGIPTNIIDTIVDFFNAITLALGMGRVFSRNNLSTTLSVAKGITKALQTGEGLARVVGRGKEREFVFDEGEQMSATINGTDMQVKVIDVDVVNGFYSALEQEVYDSKQDKMPAKKWLDRFKGREEAKWTGLNDWLESQQGAVSKQDILDYMKENRIVVSEVVMGDFSRIKDAKNEFKRSGYELQAEVYTDSDGRDFVEEDSVTYLDKDGEIIGYDDLPENLKNVVDNLSQTTKDTKYSQYQLEGEKENYREVLVTLPRKLKSETITTYKVFDKDTGGLIGEYGGRVVAENIAKRENGRVEEQIVEETGYVEPSFKSSHFDEPNILVHLRMNERTDAEGNKVLFLEEVQSDWAQKGRREGFDLDKKQVEEKYNQAQSALSQIENKIENKYGKDWDLRGDIDEVLSKEDYENYRKAAGERAKWGNLLGKEYKTGIPTAPFVMNTSDWVKLAMRVALKEAVKSGANSIAWTTGEQQNDRFDLSKSVDQIVVIKVTDNSFNVVGRKGGERLIERTGIDKRELEATVGKDITEKAINGQEIFEGQDLKVGGKGMIGFYGDVTKPGIVGQVASKLFGQEVGKTKVNDNEQPAVTVTPKMRAEVERGLPQMSKAAPRYVRDISVLITPATIRAFDKRTERIKQLSLIYDDLVKEYNKSKSKEDIQTIKDISKQILDEAKKQIIDDFGNIDGVFVTFKDDKIGLWEGKFEPSFNMTLSISSKADTKSISKVLFDFAERYSQDAFILESKSDYHDDYVAGKIQTPLTQVDKNGLLNYPQIVYTFGKSISDEQLADLSNALQSKGVEAFSINNDELRISVITFLTEEQTSTLTDEQQYDEKAKDFLSRREKADESVNDVLGSNALLGGKIVIIKSHYAGAINEGTTEPTRRYDKSNILKAFQKSRIAEELLVSEFAKLRNKQIRLSKEKKTLSEPEQARFDQLLSIIQPIVSRTFEANKRLYEAAKSEIESIAEQAVKGYDAFISKFGIKKPERASVKTLRWYSGYTEKLGDGARVNIIVSNDKDVDAVFNAINEKYPAQSPNLRRINEVTDIGYPKRLMEFYTSNGVIAEMQVMTPQSYLAKDGVAAFTENKQLGIAELKKIQDRLGWKIPDGLGHYFYEINRDYNVPEELRQQAAELSLKYYDAFTNENSKLDESFMDDVLDFKNKVDNADKTNWDSGNKGIAPKALTNYYGDQLSKAAPRGPADDLKGKMKKAFPDGQPSIFAPRGMMNTAEVAKKQYPLHQALVQLGIDAYQNQGIRNYASFVTYAKQSDDRLNKNPYMERVWEDVTRIVNGKKPLIQNEQDYRDFLIKENDVPVANAERLKKRNYKSMVTRTKGALLDSKAELFKALSESSNRLWSIAANYVNVIGGMGAKSIYTANFLADGVFKGLSTKKEYLIGDQMQSESTIFNHMLVRIRVQEIQRKMQDKFDEFMDVDSKIKEIETASKDLKMYAREMDSLEKKYNKLKDKNTQEAIDMLDKINEYMDSIKVTQDLIKREHGDLKVDKDGNYIVPSEYIDTRDNVRRYLDRNNMLIQDSNGKYSLGTYQFANNLNERTAFNENSQVLEQYPELYEKLMQRADAYHQAFITLLDMQKDAGMLSKESYDDMVKYKYVPMRYIGHMIEDIVVGDDLKINSEQSKLIKRLTGGSEENIDMAFDEALKFQAYMVVRAIAKNNAMQKIYEAAKSENFQGPFYEPDVTGVDADGNFKYGNLPAEDAIIYFFMDGKKMALATNKEIAMAFNGSNIPELPVADEVLGWAFLTTPFRAVTTNLNPGFGLAQLILDIPQALLTNEAYSNVTTGLPRILFRDLKLLTGKGIGELSKKLGIDMGFDKEWNELAMEAREYGGLITFTGMDNETMGITQAAEKAMDKKTGMLTNAFLAYRDKVEQFGTTMETVTRLAVYRKMRNNLISEYKKANNGKAPTGEDLDNIRTQAAATSLNVLNYNRGGKYIKPLNRALAYLNVAFQVPYSIAQYAKKNPYQFTLKAMEVAMWPALTTMLAYLSLDDDDKEKYLEIYNNYNEYEKFNYWHIVNPSWDGKDPESMIIRIKKPTILLPLVNPTEVGVMYAISGGKTLSPKDYLKNQLASDINAMQPVGWQLLSSAPSINALMKYFGNYDVYRKTPIIKNEKEMFDWKEGQTDENVGKFYKYVAEKTKYLGDTDRETFESISPARMDAAVKSAVGNYETNITTALPLMVTDYALSRMSSDYANFKDPAQTDEVKSFMDKAWEGVGLKKRFFAKVPEVNPRIYEELTFDKKMKNYMREEIRNMVDSIISEKQGREETISRIRNYYKEATKNNEYYDVKDLDRDLKTAYKYVDNQNWLKDKPKWYRTLIFAPDTESKILVFDISTKNMSDAERNSALADFYKKGFISEESEPMWVKYLQNVGK